MSARSRRLSDGLKLGWESDGDSVKTIGLELCDVRRTNTCYGSVLVLWRMAFHRAERQPYHELGYHQCRR